MHLSSKKFSRSQLPKFYITVLNDKNVTEIGGETNVPIDMNAAIYK